FGRALSHRGSHPTRKHRVRRDAERPGVLSDRPREPDDAVLRCGVRAAGAFRFLAGGRTGEYQPAEATSY
ncbi:MAG TPA: hypothetical protein VFX76_20005, partial [Roseiflexaceae bacterium]|nr:hypothetical protein [Roseiflexaceae bacterium]